MKKAKPAMLLSIFFTMFNIGAFTFGGGLSMIPQMTRVFVTKRGWIEENDIVDLFAVAQSLPGVIAVNASILVGYRLCGVAGALAAAFGSVLPSFIVLAGVTVFYEAFVHNAVVLGVLRGARAAVAALLFSSALRLGKSSVSGLFGAALFAASLALALLFDINPVWLLLGGALAGLAAAAIKLSASKKKEGR